MKKLKSDWYLIVVILLLALIAIHAGIHVFEQPESGSAHTITVFLEDSDNERWNNLKAGLRTSAKEQQLSLNIMKVPAFHTIDEQQKYLETMNLDDTDALIFYSPYTISFINMLNEKHVVIPSISLLNQPDTAMTTFAPDYTRIGETLVDQMVRNTKKESMNVGLVVTNPEEDSTSLIEKTMVEKLQANKINIVWYAYHTTSARLTELQNSNHADVMIALDNEALETIIDYKNSNHEDIVVYGVGISNKCLYQTDMEVIRSMVVVNEFEMGYDAMNQMGEYLNKKGTLRQQLIPYSIITKANLYTKKNQEILFPVSQ